jgi:hypothetical protein
MTLKLFKTKNIRADEAWLSSELSEWAETFQDEDTPELDIIIEKLQGGDALTADEYRDAIFHLWQKSQG